jgi:hypothetical protein
MRHRLLTAAAVTLTLIIGIVMTGGTAGAVDDIVVSIDSVAFGDEGDRIPISEQAVPAELVGATCTGDLTVTNNESAHNGNNLIITTGGVETPVPDVEAEENLTLEISGSIVLGDTLTVEMELGPGGVTSGGLTLTLDCTPVTTTTLPEAQPEQPIEAQPDFTG